MTPKLKSETTRLCVAVLTIKQELAGGGVHIPYSEGGIRCAAAPVTCTVLLIKIRFTGAVLIALLTASRYWGKIYIVCDCQGVVKMLQKQETKVKLQKRLKEAYWNYLIMIQQIVEERKEENRGETEFVWIKSHMGRKGLIKQKPHRTR